MDNIQIKSRRKKDYCGIYKITNLLNGKIYIGQSQHCLDRWSEHKFCSKDNNNYRSQEHLYRSMRKYGIENFQMEVIEELPLDRELLTAREQYWIDYYNTMDPQFGYNEVPALDAKRGENSNWAVLTNQEVEEIIDLLLKSCLPMKEIAEQYHVSGSCIEDINKGKNRFNPSLSYPIRKNAASIGHAMTTSQFTADEIMLMRQRYVTESLKDILKDYPQLTESGLKKILYGTTYKFLPYYSKRKKQWIYPNN